MSTTQATVVLDHKQIEDKIERIAWQLYEAHHQEQKLVLAGIAKRGFLLAEKIAHKLKEISPLEIQLCSLEFDKDNVLTSEYRLTPTPSTLSKQCVAVVDDVLNSGATLIYGVKYFLDYDVKSISTIVLVDRNHKNFPVKADFKGLSLSTSLREHVHVHIETPPYSVSVS